MCSLSSVFSTTQTGKRLGSVAIPSSRPDVEVAPSAGLSHSPLALQLGHLLVPRRTTYE